MAEKVQNGAFDSNLNGWSNVGTQQFLWNSGRARGQNITEAEQYRCLRQSFSVTGAVVSALISADIFFEQGAGDSNRFVIELESPDSVVHTLYDQTRAGQGTETALGDVDITEFMAATGTYYLYLKLYNTGGSSLNPTIGEYDDISILVVERFTKVVLEKIGGGEDYGPKSKATKSNTLGLVESLTNKGGSSGGNESMVSVNRLGLVETMARFVKATVLEIIGAGESLARTYGYCNHDLPLEGVGLREMISARLTVGNVTKVVTLFDQPAAWSDRVPVETDWEQTR